MTGIFGVASGTAALEVALGGAVPQVAEPERATPQDLALYRLNQAVAHEVRGQGRMRHALGIANLPISALLIVASVTLFLRRPSASWWATNAGLANMVWSLAESALDVVQLKEAYPTLLPLLQAWRQAQSAAIPAAGALPTPDDLITLYAAVFSAYGAARALYYVWMIWFASRPALRAELGGAQPADE